MPAASKSNIYFFYEASVNLRQRTALKEFITLIFKKEGRKLESLNYIFCTDQRLLSINKEYLQHDFFTDIVTFELSPRNQPVTGEIYISIDRIKENARNLKESFQKELLRVIFHGALHLCGYKDKTAREKTLMREKEDYYLSKYAK
jgi:rRNA maturation RNase YbeY